MQQHRGWAAENKASFLGCKFQVPSCQSLNFDVKCFGLTALEVNLNKCKKHFAKSQPEAAKLISVAREMHALDILSYKHGDSLACLNVSQSLNCMPICASPDDLLPCLTWETKLQTPALLWYSLC